jgi:UDP-4-amino-4,6-dideoxy-N-acetyl-beta-L-altrosamine N-acetyltransferase
LQQLSKYGIVLNRLEPNEIELVRTWRNSQAISEQMEYKAYISSDQQIEWFNQIQKSEVDYYYTIYVQEKPIGLIHLNKIDTELKTAHAGLFIGDLAFLGTGIVLGASILILELAFSELKLLSVFAKVNKLNRPAIDYNHLLGFEFHQNHNSEFDLFILTKSRFKQKKFDLEKLASLGKQ